MNEGHFSPEELLRIQHEVVQEHIFRGMLLHHGRYHFRAERDALQGLKGRIRVKVEGLLMEAARRIDEIATLEERFFDESVRIRRTDTPSDQLPLNERLLHLLEVIGEENTLGHIVAHGRMSYFDVLQNLDLLLEDDLIRVLDQPATQTEESPQQAAEHRSPLASTATWVVLALSLVALAASWWLKPLDGYAQRPTPAAERNERFQVEQRTARIDAALDLYHQAEGHYPQRLEELRSPLYLGESLPELSVYHYELDGEGGYRLDFDTARAPARR